MTCRVLTSAEEAASLLAAGELVALPTETVYGLGANALDAAAVARVFAAKNRPFFDPLIVHLPHAGWLPEVVTEVPSLARKLAETFWPGPLTLVLPKAKSVPALVTSGLEFVAVRVPDHRLTQRVIELAKVPIAAPSANAFGRLSPTSAEHVVSGLGDRIGYVLDGGPCRVGVESTIVRIQGASLQVLRTGGVSLEALKPFGAVELMTGTSEPGRAIAPGQLESHYAPRTTVRVVSEWSEIALWGEMKVGGLGFGAECCPVGVSEWMNLSVGGDTTEAASRFFSALHELDGAGLDVIAARRFPAVGLGVALNDRLDRGSVRG
jgi:L-threonylcarbamoyladenylate synthase